MRVFSEEVKELLSDEQIKILDKSNKKLNKEVDVIDSVLEKIKEKEDVLLYEISNKLHELKELSGDEIRLKSRKRVLLKEHQEHYFDISSYGHGFTHFNLIKNEINELKTMLEDTVYEFNN